MADDVFSLDSDAVGEIVSAHNQAIDTAESMKDGFNIEKMRGILNDVRGVLFGIDSDIRSQHESLSDKTILPKTEELEEDIDLIHGRATEAKTIVVKWRDATEEISTESTKRISNITNILSSVNVNWEPPQ